MASINIHMKRIKSLEIRGIHLNLSIYIELTRAQKRKYLKINFFTLRAQSSTLRTLE